MKTVLHIAAHLGGGVGTVLLNYFEKARKESEFTHRIISLGYAEDKTLFSSSPKGFLLRDRMASNHQGIIEEVEKADIILIHWWNHPLLYDFLIRNPLPKNRVVMWSHVSGYHPPQVFTQKIIDYSDLFVFTTPISFESREIKNLPASQKDKLRVIWSTGGIDHLKSITPKEHPGFNIGYIGTVDYAKINRNFLSMCAHIDIPDVKFIVCGGSNEKELEREAEHLGIVHKFNFTGHIKEIDRYLEVFDVFGYPLSPHHYGTCDQVIAESMAAGVAPVVLDNPMEKYMVEHKVNGIVVRNETEYVRAIHKLHKDQALRKSLSSNARKHALKTFSLTKMTEDWEAVFKEMLKIPKTEKKWEMNPTRKNKKIMAKDVFLESLGEYGKEFLAYCEATTKAEKIKAEKNIQELAKSSLWQAKTKGTVHNYSSFFSKDRYLSIWSKLMK